MPKYIFNTKIAQVFYIPWYVEIMRKDFKITVCRNIKIIGKRILERRKELGLSQEQLAERAKLHRNYIGYVERAEKK